VKRAEGGKVKNEENEVKKNYYLIFDVDFRASREQRLHDLHVVFVCCFVEGRFEVLRDRKNEERLRNEMKKKE
jgi:hypothetical protein